MSKLEKVIKGLECHLMELSVGHRCYECPYWAVNPCETQLIANALELLIEREPRVLTLKEFQEMKEPLDGESICYEIMQGNRAVLKAMLVKTFSTCEHLYNKAFRVWNICPTDEKRKKVKWDV